MRVLHISDGRLFGGVETILATLGRHRSICPGYEHEFALSWEGRLSRELTEEGAMVHPLGGIRLRNPISIWRGRRRLRRVLDLRRADVAIVHQALPQMILGPAVQDAGVPLVSWQHGPFEPHHWVERCAGKTIPRLALCNSRFVAAAYAQAYPQTPHEVLYYPIDPAPAADCACVREAVRKELDTPPEATVVIQVGRMERWKGHAVHLQALARLTGVPNWVCWIVGGPQRPHEAEYLGELRATCARLALTDRVRFIGERKDARRLLAGADIFCQPNTEPEAFGIVFIEAMYAGLPVVSSAVGGPVEIVDGSCGETVPPNDPGALAEVLRRYLEDSSARRRAGMAGAVRARALCDPLRQMTRLSEVLAGL